MRIRRSGIAVLFAFLLAFFVSGCSTASYLFQATRGQLMLMNRSKPLDEVIADERTPPRVRDLLAKIPEIKAYGESRGLKPTSNYREYVQLDGPAVVWVVSACRPLEFKSRTWSFPIAGSFTYLGWFGKEDAVKFASELEAEGWDVDVRGASAYSTLGWFPDPVLSTMIDEGDSAFGSLVNVVIHESVHATFYVNGQSPFNESVASFVADELTLDYFEEKLGMTSAEARAYFDAVKRGDERRKRLFEAYHKLDEIYRSDRSDEEKLTLKRQILGAVKEELGFKREITNATLIQYRTYGLGKKGFESLFASCDRQWPCFWERIRAVENDGFFPKNHAENLDELLLPLSTAKPGR